MFWLSTGNQIPVLPAGRVSLDREFDGCTSVGQPVLFWLKRLIAQSFFLIRPLSLISLTPQRGGEGGKHSFPL